MKKRLLLQLLAMVCVVGAYAADYLYSPTAKYRISGANLVENGDFSQGFAGWTNIFGDEVSSTWSIAEGRTTMAVESQGVSADSVNYLHNRWMLDPGNYVVTFWVKGTTIDASHIDVGSSNYVNFFLNGTADNTIGTAVATSFPITTVWSQVVFPFTATADNNHLEFQAASIISGTLFTDFAIYKADEVYDTRIAERYIAFVEKLMSEPALAAIEDNDPDEGITAAEVLENLSLLKIALDEDPEDEERIEAEIEASRDEDLGKFMDRHVGNAVGTYLTNWNTWPYINWNNMSTRNQWTFEGGRWGFSPNDESLERPAEDGYVASAGIQTSYSLDVGMRIAAGTFNNTSINKPGKYMFYVEAQAVASANKAAPYGADPSVIIANPYLWVGGDTIIFENDTLNGNYWKPYYAIVDITEEQIANGTEVSAGFHFPTEPSVANRGGRYSLRNPEFRLVAKSQAEVDHMYSYDQLQVQQNAFALRLDSAKTINAYTFEAGYPWGHAVLQESIDTYQPLYEELLTVVDADGNELQPERVTLEFKDQILAAVQALNSAISTFYNNNRTYTTLIADIAIANASLKDPANAAGDKAVFQEVISKAQAMVDGTTIDADEMDAFKAMEVELFIAKEEFEKASASREHPTNLYVQDKNLNFESWTSKSTYSSDRTVNGWELTIGADGKQWDIAPNDGYKLGGRASIWRGTSVGPNGKIRRTAKITTPGVYEFRTRAFSAEYGDGAKWDQYMAIANICGSILDWETFENAPVDTIYKPNVRVFFGQEGAVNDSVTLTKCAPADFLRNPVDSTLLYTRERGMVYSVIFVKTTPATDSLTVELGLEAFENGATAGASTFGLGDNQFLYLGPEAAYQAATDADYTAEVNKAKELIAKYDPEKADSATNAKVGFIRYKLMRYVGDSNYPWADGFGYTAPTTIQEKQNVILTLQELEEMISWGVDPMGTYEELGINEVVGSEPAPVVRTGVFNMSGVKVGDKADLNNLPKGLYIINGKKYMVR